MKMKMNLQIFLVGLVFMFQSDMAHAYKLLKCGLADNSDCDSLAKVSRWCEPGACAPARTITPLSCSMGGPGTVRYAHVEKAADAWNHVYGAWDKIRVASAPCPPSLKFNFRDNKSEIAFATADNFDGADGITNFRYRVDKDWFSHDHVDVLIHERLSRVTDSRISDCSSNNEVRTAYFVEVHELAHALGLQHGDQGFLSVVNSGDRVGPNDLFCNTNQVAADDERGMRTMYESGNTSIDIAISPSKTTKSDVFGWGQGLDRVAVFEACPGEVVDFRFSVQNKGMVGVNYDRLFYLKEITGSVEYRVGAQLNWFRSADSLRNQVDAPWMPSLNMYNDGYWQRIARVRTDVPEHSYVNNRATVSNTTNYNYNFDDYIQLNSSCM